MTFVMIFVLGLLAISSIGLYVFGRLNPSKDCADLKSKICSWWIMVAVFFPAILLGRNLTMIFFGFLSFWTLKEYITILDTRRADHHALIWVFFAIPVQYYWIYTQWYGMFILFIPVYMFLFLPLRLVFAGEASGFLSSTAKIQWGLMAFVFGLSHMAYLSTMPNVGEKANGQSLLLFLVLMTELNDIFQYCWGKLLGRHKIVPTVSPNKTSEGFWGGIISTIIAGIFLRFLTPFGMPEIFFISYAIALTGFFGDVVMSAVKRDAGIKDFGRLLPGHGGMLDRVDSLCYTAPIFFHIVRYFYY